MLKIGLITFHRTTNFGSCLQTYGLYKKITDLGYDCDVIDYRCLAIEKREKLQKEYGRSIREILKRMYLRPVLDRKARALEKFSSNNISFSVPYDSSNIVNSNADYSKFIVGSDIVWGLDITKCDYAYFLNFVADEKGKFAFSSSVGTETDDHWNEIRPLLKRFDRIAVREISAVKWVKDCSGCNADLVCDPTMLLTADEWRVIIPFEQIKKNYVLVYFNNPGKKTISDAIEYGHLYGKKVLYINYGLPQKGVVNIKPCTLNEFLSYIFYADHVFTSSYHGMLFSLYFNKELTYYTRDHASRMLSLAKHLGIQEQCGDKNDIKDYQLINYSAVNRKISEFRQESIEILKDMLKE